MRNLINEIKQMTHGQLRQDENIVTISYSSLLEGGRGVIHSIGDILTGTGQHNLEIADQAKKEYRKIIHKFASFLEDFSLEKDYYITLILK